MPDSAALPATSSASDRTMRVRGLHLALLMQRCLINSSHQDPPGDSGSAGA